MSAVTIIDNGTIVKTTENIFEILKAKLSGKQLVYEDSAIGAEIIDSIRRQEEEELEIARLEAEVANLEKASEAIESKTIDIIQEAAKQMALLEQEAPGSPEVRKIINEWKNIQVLAGDPQTVTAAVSGIAVKAIKMRKDIRVQREKGQTEKKKLLNRADALLAHAQEMETMTLSMDTPQGKKVYPGRINERTNGMLESIRRQAAAIGDKVKQEGIDAAAALLSKLEKQLAELPELASGVMRLEANRNTQMALILQRIGEHGWRLEEIKQPGNNDAAELNALGTKKISIVHKSGATAALHFAIDGKVEVDYLTGELKYREELSNLAVDALRQGGAKDAQKHCLDDLPDDVRSAMIGTEDKGLSTVRQQRTVSRQQS